MKRKREAEACGTSRGEPGKNWDGGTCQFSERTKAEARGETLAPWRPSGCSTLMTAVKDVRPGHTRPVLGDVHVPLNPRRAP